MFFQGDLKSGITAALHQSKCVACFVQDDGAESLTWENDFLKDEELSSLLAAKAIALRLTAGTLEAGYLAEIYPLPKTPTLVIILNGELKGYLVSGISKEDFLRRAKEALSAVNASAVATGVAPAAVAATAEPSTVPASQSPVVQSMLEERRVRMEALKKKQDAKVKADKAAAAAARKAEMESSAPPDPKKAADKNYAAQQKKRQQEARQERERILKRVEDDKVARRERDALKKEQLRAGSMIEEATSSSSTSLKQPAAKRSAECAVQVRLFDGTTIRSRFPSNQTLRDHVRKWVDEQRDQEEKDVPYTFKQVLTPMPNRTIGDSEEEESLQDVGLCPSATLILVEVKGYQAAYEGGATGLVKNSISTGFGIVSSGVGIVSGALGSIFGSATPPTVHNTQQANSENPSTAFRGPATQRVRSEDQQFYNGNSLSFEPRRDDVDKKD